ncbi:TonB-dependent receptor [Arenibacter aquaticus]|uniref:TonB-dependent receptor n=1 Tax=Arenibacter aquaticus TaxID=2489054 RepID=A0A430K8U8_9FLAO|nr:outer membrane beta-barrel protein [Arenibacter aquaticus]RTE55484.1 TonB-dependent receptor [Arenibacter aquaticus]
MNVKSTLLLLILVFPIFSSSQDVTITGKVVDSNNAPLEFVNALLLKADSTFIIGAVTDINGVFILSSSQISATHLKLQSLGYKEVVRPIGTATSTIDLGIITLKNNELVLDEVVITAEKPLIERRTDMLVVNVSNSILATGSNGLEILERSPGLFIEANGISLRGRTGVNVQINGMQQRLSASDLNNYLQSIPSTQIERIEIINNPSAAFDAEGSAGVVNIVLKRNGNLGTNGSANTTYGQGVYHRTSEGLSLNYRDSKTSLYLGLNHNFDQRYNRLFTMRRFSENGNVKQTYDQDSKSKTPTHAYLANIGMDFSIGERSKIGADLTTNWSKADQDANGNSVIFDDKNIQTGSFMTATDSKDNRVNFAVNAHYKTNLKDDKGNFILNTDYATYNTDAVQKFITNSTENETSEILTGKIDGSLDLLVLKVDLNLMKNKIGDLSFGLKSSFVTNKNDLDYFDVVAGSTTPNEIYSNQFEYQENINATYINWKLSKDQWTYQLGLRTELTNIEGKQIDADINFKRDYIQLFPNIFLEYKPSEKNTFGFNASRRVNRPNYNQLSPFRTFVDITTSRVGNPELIPEIASNIELIYNYDNWLDFSLSFSNTSDRIIPVLIQDDENQSTSVQLVNIDDYNYVGLNTSITLKPLKSITSRWDLEFFYNEFFGDVSGFNLSEKGSAFRIRSYNTYKFGNDWSTELNGFYQPLYNFGITSFYSRWKIDFGVQKSIFNGNGKVKFAITDIFWKYYPRGFTDFGNINEDFSSVRDSRIATLSFSYNFGNSKVRVNKNKGGAVEEKSRT